MAAPPRTLDVPSLGRRIREVRDEALRSTSRLNAIAQIDGWLLAAIVALVGFGLVMVYSASEALGYAWYQNANFFFQRQLIGLGLGALLMVLSARIDYHRWRAWSKPMALISLALLVLVLVPHVGTSRFGAQRWFTFGSMSVQPSAVATLVAVIFLARWLVDRGAAVRTFAAVRDYTVLAGLVLGLVFLEKDLGSCIVLAAIALVVLMLGGVRKRHLLMLAGIMAGLGFLAIRVEAYRASRLSAFRDPFADPLNTGFQSVQSLYALGSGGITGVGLGHSVQKYQWLPEAHTDFIFAIIGEELGFIGAVVVIGAFLFLGWRGVRAAMRAPDSYGTLIAGGITAWICLQAFLNIGAVINLIPTTGIPLPFVSYGGTSLAMTLWAVGILCNVSAQGRRQGVPRRAHVDRWRGDGGTPDPRPGRRAGAAPR